MKRNLSIKFIHNWRIQMIFLFFRIIFKLQDILSYGTLVQLMCTGFNISMVLMFMLFYIDSIAGYLYYVVYITAMCVEVYPCCYYGSILLYELDTLPYALFRCNWINTSRKFRKDLIIFTQSTLREIRILAGGIIGINLNSFFGTCKMAYSLFTVMLQLK